MMRPRRPPAAPGAARPASAEARPIIGRKSREIEAILGYTGREELIHRDDLALFDGPPGEGAAP